MNENEIPKFEGEIKPEEVVETPPETIEQWTAEDEATYEQSVALDEKKKNEELPIIRKSLGLDPNGPDTEVPTIESANLEDILEKGHEKGLVIEMPTTLKNKEKAMGIENFTPESENEAEKLTPQEKLEKAIESKDVRRMDHASYPIFKEARNNEDWPLAIEMIQYAKPGDARNGRIGVVRKEMKKAGQTYDGPMESTPEQQEDKAEKLTPQEKLEKAIESKDVRRMDHASYPIFKEARNNEDWPLAIEMIQYAKPGDARNGRIGVVRKEMKKAGQTYDGPMES